MLSSARVTRRASLLLAAWVLLLAALAAALLRPSPLLVSLGAGDEPFARGFRGGWERDGLLASGETQFRWTLDGARIELPVGLRAARAEARLRVARFSDTPAEITVSAGERVVAAWRQPPRGWRVQTIALGPLEGGLVLRFRSRAERADDPLGVALDWVELRGVSRVWPRARLLAGLLALLGGVPLLAGLATRRLLPALWSGAAVAALAAGATWADRLGGLVAAGAAGPPLLLVLALLAVAAAVLDRAWPEHARPWTAAVAPAAALSAVALVALSHPFFHYPDVDTHARFVRAIGQDATVLIDPADHQARTGAWTREVAGRRIAFPYSPVFHLLALPLAAAWDEVRAVKALGVLAAGLTVLLVHVLARALGLRPAAAVVAQVTAALVPVTASRLTLALFPALLGQALEALLIAHLVRRLDHLDGARDSAAAFAFLLLAQAAYTGSLLNVAALVCALAVAEAARGSWRHAARLLGAWILAAGLVGAVLYARFVPVLVQHVLPHVRETPAEAARAGTAGGLLRLVVTRLGAFYDVVFPLLAAAGLAALRRAPPRPRRVILSALAAGGALLVLRFVAPAAFRDVKEVELLALPVSVCVAAALAALWSRGRAGRTAAVVLGGWALVWSATRAVAFYAARFLAVGR